MNFKENEIEIGLSLPHCAKKTTKNYAYAVNL